MLIEVLKEDGLNPVKKSSSNGGEYCSPCPWCGGNDRFLIWPNEGQSGRWWCRKCGKNGSGIDYLIQKRNLTFSQAKSLIGNSACNVPSTRNQSAADGSLIQPERWNIEAEKITYIFASNLNKDIGKNCLDYLSSRGISKKTANNAFLGYNPKDIYIPKTNWGLPYEVNEAGNERRIKIPAGLVIPCIFEGKVIRLRIRLDFPEQGGAKYILVSGSSTQPMVLGINKRLTIVESELDCLLIYEKCSDFTGVVGLGSATIYPKGQILERISSAEQILVSLDSDEAGSKSSKWWITQFPNKSRRWPTPKGKDPTEAMQLGTDLRKWLYAGFTSSKKDMDSDNLFSAQDVTTSFYGKNDNPGYLKNIVRADTDSILLKTELNVAQSRFPEIYEEAKLVARGVNKLIKTEYTKMMSRANIDQEYYSLDFKLENVMLKIVVLGKKQEAYEVIVPQQDGSFANRLITKGFACNKTSESDFTKNLEKSILNIIFDDSKNFITRYRSVMDLIFAQKKDFELKCLHRDISSIGCPVKFTNAGQINSGMRFFNQLFGKEYFREDIPGRYVYSIHEGMPKIVVLPFYENIVDQLNFFQNNNIIIDTKKQWGRTFVSTIRKIVEISNYCLC